ncbi:MAG: RNA-binding transcriptional accessory protein [Prevotellaceae bacterium]|nr:RNA-binding transcriptional accessory protein [Prevotellaceae bacterium]
MNKPYLSLIAQSLQVKEWQVENAVALFSEGATIPFISRYRKEATGSMDELQVAEIKHRIGIYEELDSRKATVLKSIEEQGKMTDELREKIEICVVMSELEDIYLPYRPKRRTRASIAKEKGLEPLAELIMKQDRTDIYAAAKQFLSDKVETVEDALAGARDIIAEQVNENAEVRDTLRRLFQHDAVVYAKVSKGKEEEGQKYKDYFNFNESLKKIPSHRFLAVMRGQAEEFLSVKVEPEEEAAIPLIERKIIRFASDKTQSVEHLRLVIADAYKRLLCPSLETESIHWKREQADTEAIRVFAENLRQLLLASPLGQKRVLAIDPGFRTGCKIVCLDEQGKLLHNETIYPHPPQNERSTAMRKVLTLVEAYKTEAIAVGNGTASRETEDFIKRIAFPHSVQVFVVSEDGASIYSASTIAREEFPQYDVTVRGAISIGRRLMDPLAELVKIDPKSIGVGQYQHDVDQGRLKESLDTVVESCVNKVGVNLNTASKHLLTYVSGLGPTLAQNIVDYRKEHGAFTSRAELQKVKRLGEKAFEQCAGFLRIPDAENPLDNSAVHPERYGLVKQMAKDIQHPLADLLASEEVRKKIKLESYVSVQVGMPTLADIMAELAKPGRDPRSVAKVFEFAADVFSIDDLQPGMELPGIVTNITAFGAFVDVGVKQDGLVHISQMADRYIGDPNEVVKLHQHIRVKVLEVDIPRKRIQLTMKGLI